MNLSSQSMLGESSGNSISIDEYNIATANANEATIQKAVKKIKLSFSFMGKDYSIDSENKQDMEGQFGDPIKQILQQKFEFTVDASGKITAVKEDKKRIMPAVEC